MRIGILVLAAGREAGGIETYEIGMLRALAKLDRVNQYKVYCPNANARKAINVQQDNFQYHILSPSSRFISMTFTLPLLLRLHKIDLFHATFAPPPWLHRNLIFTCHGLSNFLYPESFSGFTRLRLNWLHRIAIRRASLILCVSTYTAHQLEYDMGVSRDRLTVTPHGIDDEFRPMLHEEARRFVSATFNVNEPYVLYMGKLQKIKNAARLLEAYRIFRLNHPEVKLVLAGKLLHIPSSLRRPEDRDGIVQLGHVRPEHRPALYCASEMLLFPSLFESFGMPPVEAMRCGTPVVSSTAAAIPEVCGDAAYLVDPYSVEAIVHAMEAVYCDRELRQSLAARGLELSKRYTWQKNAQLTLDAYERVFRQSELKGAKSETLAY